MAEQGHEPGSQPDVDAGTAARHGELTPHPAPHPVRRAPPRTPSEDAAHALQRLIADGPRRSAIEARCAERLRSKAYLIDARRLLTRTMARLAVSVARAEETDEPWAWQQDRIDAAIDASMRSILDQDRRDEVEGLPPPEPWSTSYSFLVQAIGIDSDLARAATVRFNGLAAPARHAFFDLVLDLGALADGDERRPGSQATMQREFQAALSALFHLPEPSPHAPGDGAST